jgi:hypothetical protein
MMHKVQAAGAASDRFTMTHNTRTEPCDVTILKPRVRAEQAGGLQEAARSPIG